MARRADDERAPRALSSAHAALTLAVAGAVVGAGFAVADRAVCGQGWRAPSPSALAACSTAVGDGRSSVSLLVLLLVGVACAVVGWFVASRTRHLAGWLLLAIGIAFTVGPAAGAYAFHAVAADPGSLPGAGVAAWVELALFDNPALFVPIGLLLLTFPTGRTLSKRWSYLAWILAGGGVLSELGVAAEAIRGTRFEDGPLGTALVLSDIVEVPSLPAIAVGTLAALAAPIVRWRRSVGIEREQMRSFLRGVVVLAALVTISPIVFAVEWLWPVWPVVLGLGLGLVPVMMGVAIAGQGLFQLDRLVNRTAVYGILAVVLVAVYVASVTVIGTLLGADHDRATAAVITAGVALAFDPARRRVQRAVDRLLFGRRSELAAVTTKLAAQMTAPTDRRWVLVGLAEAIATALALPYVEIRSGDDDVEPGVAGARGEVAEGLDERALLHAGHVVGTLACLPRRMGATLDRADEEVLGLLAAPVAAAVHAANLAASLARSRERLVEAQEREQVRIRRDLHDGLGPALTGIGLALSQLGERAVGDRALLERLSGEVAAAIVEIRRIAHDLEPIALTEHGLSGALAVQAERFGALGLQVDVEVVGADQIAGTPVERAAYRIASEALTNVHRHARARSCAVRLRVDDQVELQIIDDGCGGATVGEGVGLRSIHERAHELHGHLDVRAGDDGGTVVRVLLPVPL